MGCHPDNFLTSAPFVIYGQEVLYAARGQEARSRPAQAGIQAGATGGQVSDD